MTSAQIAKIMSLVDDYRRVSISLKYTPAEEAELRAAVEAALRDAPQAEGWVMVPVDVLNAASESLGSFVSDHGWGDADMQAMDNLDAYLAAQPSAPTVVEPVPESFCAIGLEPEPMEQSGAVGLVAMSALAVLVSKGTK